MQNYDDLDIEGRNPSHLSEEEREKEEFDRRRLMRSSVTSEDGILRPVYSKTDEGDIWCHICNISLFGAQKLLRHNISSLHRIKLDEWPYPVSLWSKKEPIKSNLQGQINISDSLAPGEPAPPGMEDQVNRITSIQVSLDRHQSSPLVGLEYLLEIIDNDSPEPSYKCVLCEKRGDPRTVMAHITSYNHRMTYLHRHFPTISRAITDLPRTANYKRGANEISILVAKKIQEKFGRLQPQLVDKGQYEKNKTQYTKNCVQDYHFRETPELTFMEVYDVRWVTNFEEKMAEITSESNKKDNAANENIHEEKTTKKEESKLDKAFPKKIEPDTTKTEMKIRILTKDKINRKSEKDDKKIRPSDDTKSLSSLSSISSSPSPTRSRSRSCSRSRRRQSSRDRLRHRSNKIRNPRSRSRSRSTEPLRERDKWDKFREQIRRAEETLDRSLKFHEKNPEKHPSYPDEWKKFWNRRYKELQADGQDPSKHDFKPEWIDFWNKRMREIHNEQLASRKEDIRKRLELPEDKPPEIKHWSSSTATTTTTSSSSSSSRKTEKIVKPIETTKRSKIHIESDDDDVEYVGTKTIKPERIERIERLPPPPPTDRQDRFDYERHPRDDPREYYSYTRTRPPSYRNYYQRGGGNMSRPPPQSSSRHYSHQYTIKEKSPSPILNEDNILKEDLEIVGLLRLLTALEGQLGSLGPKVVTLLSRALAAEKVKPNSAEELLDDEDVNVLFETVKEKLKGQLFAGMIEKMAIAPTKSAIQNIAQLLHKATEDKKKKQQLKEEEEKRQKQAEMAKSLAAFAARTTIPYSRTIDLPPIRSEPVSVPGIGSVDKIAIAQQIAAALLAQGRDNVSQDELETLINAVVGMAEASKHSDKPITAASFVKSLTDNNNEQVHETTNNTIIEQPKVSPLPPPPQQQQQIVPTPAVVVAQPVIPLISPPIIIKQREPTPPPPPPQKIIDPIEAHAARMENLTDNDLKDLLQNFKDLGTDEQHGLINFLKKLEASDPERVEKLRGFVNLGGGNNSTTSNNNKRRSISPQSDVEYISTKSRQSVSPFSTRKGGHNPSDDEHSKWKPKLDMFADEEEEEDRERRQQQQRKQLQLQQQQQQQKQQQQQQTKQQLNKNRYDDDKKRGRIELSDDDDDDDDYSFEDIYKAANKNVVDSEKAKNKRISRSKSFSRSWSRSRSRSISPPKNNSNNNNNKRNDDSMGMLSETNRLIETLMVNLPNKYVIKSHNNTSKPTSNISRNNDVPPPGSTIVSMPPPSFQNPPSYQNQNIQLTQPPPQQQQQQDVTYPGPLGQHQFAAYQQQNSQQFNSNSNYMNMGLNNGYGNYNQNNYNQGLNTNQQYLQPPPNYVPPPQMFSGGNNNQYGGQQGQLTQGPPSGPPPVGYPQQTQYPNYSQQQQQQQRFY
ncbi:uncharacterized protein CG7065-like [Aphidius gifuensis]|nr:uncharacterized protein CG7065-like [Aphidius gifuensis]XP_044004556.1 uncharacterized protein CG7065-like [Aphidius gifuensis]XP_044004557.1 uncharacterized protein CG7065-like [Aphidius gifuensis]